MRWRLSQPGQPWSRGDKIAFWSFVVAIVGLVPVGIGFFSSPAGGEAPINGAQVASATIEGGQIEFRGCRSRPPQLLECELWLSSLAADNELKLSAPEIILVSDEAQHFRATSIELGDFRGETAHFPAVQGLETKAVLHFDDARISPAHIRKLRIGLGRDAQIQFDAPFDFARQAK